MSDEDRALAELVRARSGIVLREGQLGGLAAALRRIDPELRPGDVVQAVAAGRAPAALDEVIDAITVKETFFLRHMDELADVDWAALAGTARADGRGAVRVWSAGCATGEEAYSLAMLAAEAADEPVDLLGTDIAPSALEAARRGVYGDRSLRLLAGARRQRWVMPHARGGRLRPELRGAVRFARHNLVHDPAPPVGEGPFDLIVCRNVLIYFDAVTATATVGRLRGALAPGGRLVIGTADRLGQLPGAGPPLPPAPSPRRCEAVVPPPPPAPTAPPPAPAPPGDAVAALEAGTAALGDGDADAAVGLLRRALYLDPAMALAALQLGRAHELRGDPVAARHAYHRALRLAEAQEDPTGRLYDRIGVADVVLACAARLRELEP